MGKKFIIEIEDKFLPEALDHVPARLYRVKGFNSLVFDENGLEKLTPYDESAAELRGAEKAWKLAQRIGKSPLFGGMLSAELRECFGSGRVADVIDMPYAEAAEKYELWQKKKKADDAEITVGDEVRCGNVRGIVLQVTEKSITVIIANGYVSITDDKQEWKKTGRHFPEVAELLKKIGGNEE